jgi:hypothetical protein
MASVISPERIAAIIEDAPAWALIGLTAPREGLRADARLEVARDVYGALYVSLRRVPPCWSRREDRGRLYSRT